METVCPGCNKRFKAEAPWCPNCGMMKESYPPKLPTAPSAQEQVVIAEAIRARSASLSSPSPDPASPPSSHPQLATAGQKWEYIFMEFGYQFDWVLTTIDHKEAPKQLKNKTIAEFSAMLGKEGWELVSSIMTVGNPGHKTSLAGLLSLHGGSDTKPVMLLTFKRPNS